MYFFPSFLGWIVIIVIAVNLYRRIGKLEREVKRLSGPQAAAQTTAQDAIPVEPQPVVTQAPADVSMTAPQNMLTQELSMTKLADWLKEDWLLKLGALLLLIGFGWLVTYAFMNNWIGPMGRIALGLIAGIALLLLGWWRMQRFVHQGSIFLVLGSTVVLLTLFAAREVYNFFTPLSALIVMFLSAAFVALASVRYKTQTLALLSIILAGIAPLLTNATQPDYVGLFSYLLVVVAGAVWVVFITGWRSLTIAALVLVAFYSSPHLAFGAYYVARTDRSILLMFEYAFAAIFFLTTLGAIVYNKATAVRMDLLSAGGNGLLLLVWILAAAPQEWKSLLIIAWMLVFMFGAFATFRATGRKEPFYVFAATGVAMLGAATSVQFSGHTMVIAYAIEAAAVSVAVFMVMRDVRVAEQTSILTVVPAILSFESIVSSRWRTEVFHADFFVLLVVGAAFFVLGLFIREQYRITQQPLENRFYPVLIIVGSAYAYTLIWLSLHAAIKHDDTATTIALLVYTLIGLVTYFFGRFKERRIVHFYGGVLLGLVVFRLLLVDVWRMALSGRIITFFLIGALLMGTAFIGRRSTTKTAAS